MSKFKKVRDCGTGKIEEQEKHGVYHCNSCFEESLKCENCGDDKEWVSNCEYCKE